MDQNNVMMGIMMIMMDVPHHAKSKMGMNVWLTSLNVKRSVEMGELMMERNVTQENLIIVLNAE